MNIGIIGLGLIGGSMAKAFSKVDGVKVLGYDINDEVIKRAILINAIDEQLAEDKIKDCQYIFIATYPKACVEFLEKNAKFISKDTIVCDLCGTKRQICNACFPIAEKYGFHFIGGHPMAGTQFSGLKYSKNDMFKNATIIFTPKNGENIMIVDKLKMFLENAGFKKVTVTTPEMHDKMIAYTSQLAHVVSNAYVKSPNCNVHKGFSAGSYRDLTRVAKLNPSMWTELFIENKDNLINELDYIIENLQKYKIALEENNSQELYDLLLEGSLKKEQTDG